MLEKFSELGHHPVAKSILRSSQHPDYLPARDSLERLTNTGMATFDRRRIQAPETSYAPTFIPNNSEAGPSKRTDRRDDEARPICQSPRDIGRF